MYIKFKKNLFISVLFVSVLFSLQNSRASDPDAPLITAHRLTSVPVIDGIADEIWDALPWYSLNYVWINWEESVDSTDFYGRFKIAWSEETDRLYFLVEITDDVLIERFAEMMHTNHYNDVVEVFLDEDNSGGLHVFDGDGNWGTNAENAFSYHITPLSSPEINNPVTEFTVGDMDGTDWSNSISENYISHFPEVILATDGERYTWEFSLTVYTDEYETESPGGTEAELYTGKELGFAMAYCEADNPDVYLREMFMGTYEGHGDKLTNADDGNVNYGYNEAWKDASDYNLLVLDDMLIPEGLNKIRLNARDLNLYCSSEQLYINYESLYTGKVHIEIFNSSGELLNSTRFEKTQGEFRKELGFSNTPGIYLVRLKEDGQVLTGKFILR